RGDLTTFLPTPHEIWSESIKPAWALSSWTAQIGGGVDSDELAHGCAIEAELLRDRSDVHAFAAQRVDLGMTTRIPTLDSTLRYGNCGWRWLWFAAGFVRVLLVQRCQNAHGHA